MEEYRKKYRKEQKKKKEKCQSGYKTAAFLVLLFTLCVLNYIPAEAAGRVQKMEIEVALQQDGSAHVTQVVKQHFLSK